MKTTRILFLRNSPFALAAMLFALTGSRVNAQTSPKSAAAIQAPAVPARITEAIDETQLVAIKGSLHPLARPEFDHGTVPDSTPMNRMLLFLQRSPEQEAALQQLMADQMSKASPNFHNWLTPAQFGAEFGPADADIQTVTNWLSSQGFHDIKVGTGKLTIEFSGNVGLVRHVFHIDIHHFFVNGEMRQANVSDPQIPIALTPVVAGIVSLHNFPKRSMIHRAGAFNGTRDTHGTPQLTGPTNCGTAGNPPCFYALGPADFAAIYDIPAALTGAGSKVAIIGFSNINIQDVRDFRTLFGLPTNDPAIVLNGPDPGIAGEESEADLDVEWSGAVAPQAEIDFIVSEDTLTSGGLELSSLYAVDNNTDDIVSLSFGACEAGLGAENAFLNALWEQAAAQGITVFVSAGDPGSAGCDDFNTATVANHGLAVNGLASTPFNIAVGGTDFDDVGKQTMFWNSTNAAGTRQSVTGYIPETTWNDSCAAAATSANLNTICATANNIVGGGGGVSTIYKKASWQRGTGVPGANSRNLPDVSLFASNGPQSQSFYLVCEADAVAAGSPPSCASSGSFSFLGVGGTSASSPSFAGILALIEQSERTRVPGSSGRQGNANFVLYNIFQTASNSCSSSSRTTPGAPPPAGCVFNDVTKGNNSVPCAATSPNCSSTTTGPNGVLVEPSSNTTPAWTTTAGYDLATGLGSVNVANLATAWGSAVGAFTPTSTTTTVNGGTAQVTITHGASVTLAAKVTSRSGTPTGDVSFPVPTTVNGGVGDATLGGGTASVPTTFLPGGTYNVKAHYAGDGAFAPSDDPTGVPVTVNKENSRLQYGIVTFDPTTGAITNTNAISVVYGSPYILRIDILNSTNSACQSLVSGGTTTGCAFDATGTVTITDNGSPLDTGTFTINSQGHAEDQQIQLSVGTNALSATYSGDISYNPATTAVTDTVTVSQAATTTALVDCCSQGTAGQSYTVVATVSSVSNGALPSGTASLFSGATQVAGPVTLRPIALNPQPGLAQSSVVFTTSSLPGGNDSLTVQYSGDSNYKSSVSAAQNAQIFFTDTTTLALSSSTIQFGSTITFTATVTPVQNNGPTLTGSVQFTIDGHSPPPTVNLTNGQATYSTSTLAAGIHSVQAFYSGDTNYASSATPTADFTVIAPFTVSGSAVTVTAGNSGNSTATVTPSGGFTGNVAITCAALPGVTCGALSINVTSASPANGQLSVSVAAPSSSTTAMALSSSREVWATTLPPGGSANRGWWMLATATGFVAALLLLLPGRKRYRVAFVALSAACLVTFALGCGGGYGGGGGGGGGGGLTPTTTTVSVASTKVAVGTIIAFTVNVTSNGRAPNGQVQLFSSGAAIGSPITVAGGAASISVGMQAVGTTGISAHYMGDAYTAASQSGTLNIAVTGTTQFAITGNSGTTTVSTNASLTVN